MREKPTEEVELERRRFLLETGTAVVALAFASLLFSGEEALADDDDDDDGGGSDDDSGGGGDDDDDDDDDDDNSGPGGGGGSGNSGSGGGNDDDDDDDDRFERGALDQSDAVRAVRSGKAMSLKAALKRVEDRYTGTVIDVALRSTGARLEYSFKIRTERGTVRTIRMDAESGRFLGFGSLFR